MRINLRFIIIITLILLVISTLIQVGQPEPVNWKKTYKKGDKIPYGTYILNKELKNILPQKPKITELKESLYDFLESDKFEQDACVFYIGEIFNIGEAAQKRLDSFVTNGGTAFFSARNFDNELWEKLGLSSSLLTEYSFDVKQYNDINTFNLYRSGDTAVFDKISRVATFTSLPDKNLKLLGGIKYYDFEVPNFIEVKYGKGYFYIHLEPDFFVNYYMLQEPNFKLACQSLQYIKNKNIYWYNSDYKHELSESYTPMRFILSNPYLRNAWFLLLFTLIIFLIFKSKREQRAIEIVEPERNLSVDFAKTISSLYFENGNPGNMIKKKIEYFLFELRTQLYVDTNNLEDKKLIETLSNRTGRSKAETAKLLQTLQHYQSKNSCSVEDLKYINNEIEKFKQKANIL